MTDREEFRKHVSRTFEIGAKLKKAMVKKNLKRARAKCPDCPGKFIHGSISGKRDHLHMACECRKYQMLE